MYINSHNRELPKMPDKYSPDEYAKILEGIEVKQIALVELSAKSYPENIGEPVINVKLENKVEFQMSETSGDFNGIDKFTIIGETKNKKVVEINIHMIAFFNSGVKTDQPFLKLFEETSLKFFTYPYIRQIVQDVTAKMGMPPLVLPIWKIHRKSKNGVAKK
jgi:preprotein translocase subunit SecB